MSYLEWLKLLISHDTTSTKSNLGLMAILSDFFSKEGLICQSSYNRDKTKQNIFATLPSKEGARTGGIIFSGHIDTVPVEGQDWSTSPFQAVIHDNKVYGRGTTDMKGFIAVSLSLIPYLKRMQLKKPIHFALSYDEEVGCHGAKVLIENLRQHQISADACIVGEPSSMRPVLAHKGTTLFRCSVHGVAAHSSLTPLGCNAIDYATEMVSFIRQMARRFQESGKKDDAFDVPYSTISTNIIRGGTADNIIPDQCDFDFDLRYLPGFDLSNVLTEVQKYANERIVPQMKSKQAKIEVHQSDEVPSFEIDPESPVYQLAKDVSSEKEVKKVAYATEAGLFQNAGIPTIVWGPGNIEQAHRPNEFIDIEQLEKCHQYLQQFVTKFYR